MLNYAAYLAYIWQIWRSVSKYFAYIWQVHMRKPDLGGENTPSKSGFSKQLCHT